MVFVGGCLLQGAQAGINASAATYYPTRMRSTGVGWALGVGRLGSVIGPILGGVMIAHAWQVRSIFYVGGLPALLAAVSILSSAGLKQERNPYTS
jgi:MFS transporter, AAHS family, 4-hydroxybenzoate transporter